MNRPILSSALRIGLILTTLGSGLASGSVAMAEPIWYNCLTREVFTPEKQAWCDRWQTLQEATYQVPSTPSSDANTIPITLENGRYTRDDGELHVELVNQEGWLAFGDINGDNKIDAAVILGVAQDLNGQSVSTYLTAVLDVEGAAQATTPVRLGERIMLNGPISIANNRILLPRLTQTEVINREYVVDGTTLSELAQLPGPVAPTLPEGTVVFSQTSNYAVRIFNQDGQARLNLFNKTSKKLDLAGVAIAVSATADGTLYRYEETPSVRLTVANAGTQTLEINGSTMQDSATVTGTVTYRPRIALPPNAVVEVSLVDVSRADAPAITLASQAIVTNGRQVPIPFSLVYDPQQIDPRMSYAVQARITVDGQLRFINTSRIAVITNNNPTDVTVVVDPVSQ